MRPSPFLASMLSALLLAPLGTEARASDGILVFNRRAFAGAAFDVIDADPKNVDIRLHWKNAAGEPYATLGSLRRALLADGRVFLAATNSGIYDTDYRPLGLHIERGQVLRKLNLAKGSGGNFSLRPNGVFFLGEKGPRVVESSEFQSVAGTVREATQSGPLLLRKGVIHPEFRKGSSNRKLRSGVGVSGDGRVVFAVSRDPVNFHDFAVLFRDALDCPDALYLDGTISQLLKNGEKARDQAVPFSGMWSLTLKAAPGEPASKSAGPPAAD